MANITGAEPSFVLLEHDTIEVDLKPISNGTVRRKDDDNAKEPTTVSTRKLNMELYFNERNAEGKKQPKIEINPLFEGERDRLIMGATDDKPTLRVQFNHKDSDASIQKEPPSPPSSDRSNSTSSSSSSSSSSSESIEIAEAKPPDGGWGWTVVAASFVINLIADGVTFSFGVIFKEFLEYFGENRSTTAWVGSLFMAMPLISGPIASFLTDKYGCRKVTVVGSLLASLGFVISSQANSMMVLCLTFGLIAGFGLSLCYVASVVIVAYYFEKKRSFATGLAVCGSGIGTFIFPPVIQFLLDEYGWRGTTLILAGLFLNMMVCGCLMRDLPWTSEKQKTLAKERKKNRDLKRKNRLMSTDSFSVSTGTCTASVLQPIIETNEEKDSEVLNSRMSSSVVNLPTYIRNGEKVPLEVLELLASNKDISDILLTNYPNLMGGSKSMSDSGRLNEATVCSRRGDTVLQLSPPVTFTPKDDIWGMEQDAKSMASSTQRTVSTTRRFPAGAKSGLTLVNSSRIHRLSVTYRGAMLNLKRYRLRATSCPDIYRTSISTIAQEQVRHRYDSVGWNLLDTLVDMFDFSHFADPKFLVFALSNFLLYTWYDVPYVYLTDNASLLGYSDNQASILISIIGILNMVGEIFLGWIGDRSWADANIIYAVCMVLCGGVVAWIPLISNYNFLCMISGAFGFIIAANYSLTCVILVELITLDRFTNAYGLLLLVQGVANLIGPPIGGWLYDITGTYHLSFYLAGLFIALSGLLLVVLPIAKRYKQSKGERSSLDASIKDMEANGQRK